MNRFRRTTLVATLLALGVAGGPGADASSAHHDRGRGHHRTHSFDGTCSLEGTVTFDPGATFVQQDLTLDSTLEGTCSGTLDGREITAAPATMHNAGESSGSCLHAETTGPGPGTLTFTDGTTISYGFEFNWVGTDGVMRFQGEDSGSALAHGTFRDPGLSGEGSKCASTGVTETGITINLTTQSPLTSGHTHPRRPRSNG